MQGASPHPVPSASSVEDAAQVAHEEYQSSKDVAPGTWAFVRVHGKGRIKAIEVANQVTFPKVTR